MSVYQGESSDDSYEIDEDIEQQLNRWWREANDLENDYWYRQKQLQGKNTRNKQGKEKLLDKYCLPQCNSFREISKLINIDLEDLRLLVFSPKQDAATKHHYIRFSIPKKNRWRKNNFCSKPEFKECPVLDSKKYFKKA